MKKPFLSIMFLQVILFSSYSSGQNGSFTNSGSLAIKKASHDFEVALNTHDAKGLAALFLPKGEFTIVVGA